MKKIRITVKRGSRGKKFVIFTSPESLYVWLNDPELREKKEIDPSLGTVVHLRSGEVMEVEWRGFESVYEKEKQLFCANLIRICKDIKTRVKFSKPIVGVHEGWVTNDIITFKKNECEDTKTTVLSENSKHKFDLDELFEEHDDDINSLEDLFDVVEKPKAQILN